MEIVNYVHKGNLEEKLDLAALKNLIQHPNLVTIRHQTKQPEQLILKFANQNTLIFFKSGAFRLMGRNDELDAHFIVYEVIALFSDKIPNIILQTMTATYNYNQKIHLCALAKEEGMRYMSEFFPAVQIRNRFPTTHINIFSSGKITVTGVKDALLLNEIKTYLDTILSKYLL